MHFPQISLISSLLLYSISISFWPQPIFAPIVDKVIMNIGRPAARQIATKNAPILKFSKQELATAGKQGGGGLASRTQPNQTLTKRAFFALNKRVTRLGDQLKVVKEKAMFGLDKLPKNGQEVMYLPTKAISGAEIVSGNMMKKMLAYTGRTLYNGLWRASSAIRQIPNPIRKILFTIALIADFGHTMDEYWQVFLLSYIDPDQVGVGMPGTLKELAEGLNNFWWDAWPDFAFGVPLVFFGLNPPLLLLTQAYKTLFEYVGKKMLGELLKDSVWTSQVKPIEELREFTGRKVPKEKMLEGDKKEGEEEVEWTQGAKITIDEALLDSQMDSNLYKYFALNSMRSIYVIAVAVQVEFFKALDKVPREELSDLALQAKQKMDKDSELKEKTEKFMSENGEIKRIMERGEGAKNKGRIDEEMRKKMLREKANIFEREIEPNWGNAQKYGEMKKRVEELGEEVNGEMEEEMKPKLLKMGKRIAELMICKNEQKCRLKNAEKMKPEEKEEFENWAKTLAELISNASTTEGMKRMAMLEMKTLEGKELGEEYAKKPYFENGTIILPQCSAKMRKYFMEKAGTKLGQNKEKEEEPTKGKKWAMPYCELKSEEEQRKAAILGGQGWGKVNLTNIKYEILPVYEKEEVERLSGLQDAGMKIVLFQRSWRKLKEYKGKKEEKSKQISQKNQHPVTRFKPIYGGGGMGLAAALDGHSKMH